MSFKDLSAKTDTELKPLAANAPKPAAETADAPAPAAAPPAAKKP